MAVQPLSRTNALEAPVSTYSRRPSAPINTPNRIDLNKNDAGTCCGGGGGGHGCGCGCAGCWCRIVHFKNNSSRAAYGNEGGRPRPVNAYVDSGSRGSASSVRTVGSDSVSNRSIGNSFEAPTQFTGHHLTHAYGSEEEEDGHYAYRDFGVSSINSLDHMGDSSGMVVPGLEDAELGLNQSFISPSDSQSLLNGYAMSLSQQSATASDIVLNAGAAFGNQRNYLIRPLQLAPDCRHSANATVCGRCVH